MNYDNGIDFFIINDAIIQKICILGDDVEPCFEGASVTAPNVSTKFTLDDNFRHTLYSMMQDLKDALNEGGQQMENLENAAVVEDKNIESSATEFTETKDEITETISAVDNNTEDTSAPTDYVKQDEDDEKNSTEDNVEENDPDNSDDNDDDDD